MRDLGIVKLTAVLRSTIVSYVRAVVLYVLQNLVTCPAIVEYVREIVIWDPFLSARLELKSEYLGSYIVKCKVQIWMITVISCLTLTIFILM